jgi:hypothetical protein
VDVGLNAGHRIHIAKDVPPAIVERHLAIDALRIEQPWILDSLHWDTLLWLRSSFTLAMTSRGGSVELASAFRKNSKSAHATVARLVGFKECFLANAHRQG